MAGVAFKEQIMLIISLTCSHLPLQIMQLLIITISVAVGGKCSSCGCDSCSPSGCDAKEFSDSVHRKDKWVKLLWSVQCGTEFKGLHGHGGNAVTFPGPWDREPCLGKGPVLAIPSCSFIPKAEILIDCLTFTGKRAGNTVLLLNYGSLGLFLNVINDTSLLRARDIHQQSCVPLAQVLREFQNVTTQSSAVSTRVWNDKSPKNRSHYNPKIGINWCVFSETYFPLKLQGFHKPCMCRASGCRGKYEYRKSWRSR